MCLDGIQIGFKVIEWPPLSDCVTVTPDESAEVKAVFHMLGEPLMTMLRTPMRVNDDTANRLRTLWQESSEAPRLVLEQDPKPWPFPTGKEPEKPAAPYYKGEWVSPDGQHSAKYYGNIEPPIGWRRVDLQGYWTRLLTEAIGPLLGTIGPLFEPQVRSRREPAKCAKPAIPGLTQTAGEGRYQGLGFCAEDA